MKYFEENKLSGSDLIELHSYLGKAYTAVSSNLFFHSDIDHLESPKHRILLAKSAYNLIGICEAVAELVPEGERETALKDTREAFKPLDDDSAIDLLLKLIEQM